MTEPERMTDEELANIYLRDIRGGVGQEMLFARVIAELKRERARADDLEKEAELWSETLQDLRNPDNYTPREMRLMHERDTALRRAEQAEALCKKLQHASEAHLTDPRGSPDEDGNVKMTREEWLEAELRRVSALLVIELELRRTGEEKQSGT